MIERILQEKTASALFQLYGQNPGPESVLIENTKKEFPGDYTLVVFPLLKISRKSPETTAGELGEFLKKTLEEFDSYQVVRGFLNIKLKDKFWRSFLTEHAGNPSFGTFPPRQDAPVVVEFSSPNTNKPLHLGHIRNNLLGYSISRILQASGFRVIRVNLVNDRGIHICKSMLAYMKWGEGETPEMSGIKGDHLVGKYYVLFDKYYRKEIEDLKAAGIAEEEAVRTAPLMQEAQELLRKWETGDASVTSLWRTMNGWVYDGFDQTYRELGISFDKTYYESETWHTGKELVKEGLESGTLHRKDDGSVWADLKDEGLDEKLLLRSDGTSVYMTQDLGTAQLRYDEFRPSRMIYVVGNEQNYHFDVLQKILAGMGKDFAGKLYHLSYGMVELPHGKMKSREGTVVDADDLMEEMYGTAEKMTLELGKADELDGDEARELFRLVGLGALKYFILKVDPKKNMLFDPVESIDFNGNTGPFIQYTYARILSLLRKSESCYLIENSRYKPTGSEHSEWKSLSGTEDEGTLLPVERNILRLLYQYPAVVKEAGEMLSPALIANYIFELAKVYNQFYQEVPVLKEEKELVAVRRLLLSQFTGDVICSGMELLGIRVPSRM